MNLREYLRIARARWKVVVGSVVVTLGLAAMLTLSATPVYESSARVFFSTPQPEADVAFAGGEYSVARVATYADLVGNRRLASRVVDQLGLDASPGDVSDQVSASVTPATANLTITATDTDPVVARDVAQATAEQLSALVADLETPRGAARAPIQATVVDPATVSGTPISPSPTRNLALGLFLGLLLGFGLALVRELLDDTVRAVDDVEAATGLPVLAEIPRADHESCQPRALADGEQGPYVDALRVLRANLQYADGGDGGVYTVTSAVSGEGKTTTAANLALMLARGDQRVLLVEADLRRPRLHELLELDAAVGLTTVLAGEVRLEEAVQGFEDVERLDVLTSGVRPADAAEALQSRPMAELLTRMRAAYDVVVINTPPALPVNDAALLTAQCDGAIVVARHGKISREKLRLAVRRLGAVGGAALGVALTMTPARFTGGQYSAPVEESSTLSILESDRPSVPANAAKRPGPVVVSARIPEQGSAAGRPGAPHGQGQQVAQPRAQRVGRQVDQLRGPAGKEDRLADLDQQRAGKPDHQPGRSAPLRPERRPKKA